MESSWTIWETDFHCDNFVNQLNDEDSLNSIDDPIPTNCSFGRKKRREEMTIPQLPKCLIMSPKIGSGIGRGISNSLASMKSITKPGNLSAFCHTHSVKPQTVDTTKQKMESIIFDQNSIHCFNVTSFNKPETSDSESQEINIHYDNDFPELTSSTASNNKTLKSKQRIQSSKIR